MYKRERGSAELKGEGREGENKQSNQESTPETKIQQGTSTLPSALLAKTSSSAEPPSAANPNDRESNPARNPRSPSYSSSSHSDSTQQP